jgi:HEPN domain-containing protein
MQRERFPSRDPREWLNRAQSNLVIARGDAGLAGVYLEDLCFEAQQAAEKAIKAVLLHRGVQFPYIHDLGRLLTLVEQSGQAVPEEVHAAETLTDYAGLTRYPAVLEPVTPAHYTNAVDLATTVVRWPEGIVGYPPPAAP